MVFRKISPIILMAAISLSLISCSKSPATNAGSQQQASVNLFAKNGIQSYEVMEMQIDPSGMDASGQIIRQVEFDRQGNMLKDITPGSLTTICTYKDTLLQESVMANNDGIVINTEKMEYKGNQAIERNFGIDNVPENIRTLYKDQQGRDTLITYTTADNIFLYKQVNKYDNIGLKESVLYTDGDTTYTKRVGDNKENQVFESRKSNQTLVYRETKTYDTKGNQTEFLYEGLMDPGRQDISRHRTTYLDNGLVDTVFYLDADGNETKREVYKYKEFEVK